MLDEAVGEFSSEISSPAEEGSGSCMVQAVFLWRQLDGQVLAFVGLSSLVLLPLLPPPPPSSSYLCPKQRTIERNFHGFGIDVERGKEGK